MKSMFFHECITIATKARVTMATIFIPHNNILILTELHAKFEQNQLIEASLL